MKTPRVILLIVIVMCCFSVPFVGYADDETCEHEWVLMHYDEPNKVDDTYHAKDWYECLKCWATVPINKEKHSWIFEDIVDTDSEKHVIEYTCYDCFSTKTEASAHGWIPELDDYDEYEIAQRLDKNYHMQIYVCTTCYEEKLVKKKHNYSYTGDFVKINGTYHGKAKECLNCGEIKPVGKEKHRGNWTGKCYKKATLKSKGLVKAECNKCEASFKKRVTWKLGKKYSESYDIVDISQVYPYSRAITIKLKKPVKGSVLKVKIGNKTYEKKIKNQKKVNLRISKSSYGSKIVPKVYYKGKLIGTDRSGDGNHVLFAKKIRRGLTKKQLKYTYGWGRPNKTATGSGGVSYWYYDDGSWVAFKHGKVKDWLRMSQ